MPFAKLLALIIVAATWMAATDTPATGFLTLTFHERHPSSGYEVLGKRYGWTKPAERDLYDVAKEPFEVNVPANYDGTAAYGLIVYTNSGKGGNARQYAALMAKYHLIWIGATDVPNERSVGARWGLALDAAYNMAKRYRIDQRRVYAVGNSGGGRCSSMLAPTWPEVFSGGIYLVGCNAPMMPTDKALAAKALAGRYALVTGTKDMNRDDTKGVLSTYRGLKFAHVEYFEQPGMGHENPNEEWFTKALTFVDQPLVDEATALLAQAQTLETKKPYDAAKLLQKIIGEYPVAEQAVTTAKAHLATLAPTVETALAAEMTKLGAGSKDAWRAMAKRAAGFACASQAISAADGFGAKELAPLVTAGSASKIAKFADEWADYPCAITARDAYEQLAAKALQPLSALEPAKRDKALVKFLKDWQDCASRTAANEQLEGDLDAELTTLLALTKGRDAKVTAFAKNWPGTAAAAKAIAALTPPEPAAK